MGTLAHSGRGEGGVRMRGEPAVAVGGMTCSSLSLAARPPGEVVPGSREAGSGGLHRLLGGVVWIVTCVRTKASSWWQQQP